MPAEHNQLALCKAADHIKGDYHFSFNVNLLLRKLGLVELGESFQFHLRRPLWSELAMGGMVEHSFNCAGVDTSAMSVKDSLPLLERCVVPCTARTIFPC